MRYARATQLRVNYRRCEIARTVHDADPNVVPLSYATPKPRLRENLRPKTILLDVVLIYMMTFVVGCFFGSVDAILELKISLVYVAAAGNLVAGTLGFVFSAGRAPHGRRMTHVGIVAILLWLISATNMLWMGVSFRIWMAGGLVIIVMAAIGAAIGAFIRKDRAIEA
jgi:hypothetical protein